MLLSSALAEIHRKLGDPAGEIWGDKEILRHLTEALGVLSYEVKLFFKRANLDDEANQALYPLPDDFIQMNRVTWGQRAIEPLSLKQLRSLNYRYDSQIGSTVLGYTLNQEGFRTMRKYPAPTLSTGLRRGRLLLEEFSPPDNDMTAPDRARLNICEFGISGNNSTDTTVIEYIYVKNPDALLDVPKRIVVYLYHFVLWQCFLRSGLGQDLKLAAHWKGRWDIDIARLIVRKEALKKHRVAIVGTKGKQSVAGDPRRPRLPWNYGPTVR